MENDLALEKRRFNEAVRTRTDEFLSIFRRGKVSGDVLSVIALLRIVAILTLSSGVSRTTILRTFEDVLLGVERGFEIMKNRAS